MIDCHEVMRRLWAYLDGELAEADATEVREHIDMCARCYPQHRFQLAFLGAVVRAHQHGRGPRPRADFVQRLRAALSGAGGGTQS